MAYPLAAWLAWAAVLDFGHGWQPAVLSAVACVAMSLLVPLAHAMGRLTPRGLTTTYILALAACLLVGLGLAILVVPLAVLPLGAAYGFALHAADFGLAASR